VRRPLREALEGDRPDIAWPHEQKHRHFASGVNHPGEVEGIFASGRWVGIAAQKCPRALREALEDFGHRPSRLFVDSGAFSEVKFGADGPRVVRPISDAKWLERFETYQWAAAAFGPRAYLVAPDQVGNQTVNSGLPGRDRAGLFAGREGVGDRSDRQLLAERVADLLLDAHVLGEQLGVVLAREQQSSAAREDTAPLRLRDTPTIRKPGALDK